MALDDGFFVLGDIGGTSARLQLERADGNGGVLARRRTSTTGGSSSMLNIVQSFLAAPATLSALRAAGGDPRTSIVLVALAVCGPVDAHGVASLFGPHFGTNGWSASTTDLEAALGCEVTALDARAPVHGTRRLPAQN
jgi:glucokinase